MKGMTVKNTGFIINKDILAEINKRVAQPETAFICDTLELANKYNVKIGTTIRQRCPVVLNIDGSS